MLVLLQMPNLLNRMQVAKDLCLYSLLQTGQNGQFVYVVKPGRTVELRPVKVGDTVGNETAIKQGLKHGEQVVTDGQFNLVPGANVEIKAAQPQANNS